MSDTFVLGKIELPQPRAIVDSQPKPKTDTITLSAQVTYLCPEPKCGRPMNVVKTDHPRQIACSNPLCKAYHTAYWEPTFEARKA